MPIIPIMRNTTNPRKNTKYQQVGFRVSLHLCTTMGGRDCSGRWSPCIKKIYISTTLNQNKNPKIDVVIPVKIPKIEKYMTASVTGPVFEPTFLVSSFFIGSSICSSENESGIVIFR